MPDFAFERRCAAPVCGIDEAGRGPLAGPVIAAAVVLDQRHAKRIAALGLDDSKKLSAAKREALFAALPEVAQIGVGQASVEEIDALNILRATFLAMRRAVEALPLAPAHILVDGNLAPPELAPLPVTPLVGGDGKSLSIAAASIVAKVTRDRIMTALAETHPHYGWARNSGYGTAAHRAAIARHGFTAHHRRSFNVQLELPPSST
jgi:ribonuclease HII